MNSNFEPQDVRDTFDLMELFQQIKKYFWILLLSMLVMGAAGFGISKFLIEPEYESAITMIVNTRQDNSGVVTNDNITSAQNLVSTYSVIIKSNTVLNQVISALGLDTSYDELDSNVYVNAVDDTQIMRIAVRDTDKARSAEIVEAIADIAPDVIVDIVEAGSCKVISQVMTSDNPVTPNVLKNTLLMAVMGLLISTVVIVLCTLFKIKKIVDDNDAQKYIGLTVLGVIPEVEGEEK